MEMALICSRRFLVLGYIQWDLKKQTLWELKPKQNTVDYSQLIGSKPPEIP